MKKPICPLLALLAAAPSLPAATLTWTGTTSGAWNVGIPANWSGVAPVFDNTAAAVFNGATPINTYNTYLGDGPRTVRSISCLGTFTSPFEIRTQTNDGVTGRILHFSSNSGPAQLSVASTITQPVTIGQGSGTAIGSVNLVSDLTIDHQGTGLLTISRPVNEGSAGRSITKTGSGTLLLSAANTFSGSTFVNGGIVRLGNATGLGTTAGDTLVASGGTLDFNGLLLGAGETVSITGTGQGDIGALYQTTGNTGNANSIADNLILTGNASVGGAAGTRYGIGGNGTSSTIGLFTLTKVGLGQFDLRGSVTIGDIVVNEGALQTEGGSVYNTGYTMTVNPGAEFRSFNISNPFPRDFLLNGGKIYSGGSLPTGNLFTGNITLTGSGSAECYGETGDAIILSGNIGESAPGATFTIAGTRGVTLNGTNSYTGLTSVNSGTLGANGSFAGGITVANGAVLDGEGITSGTLTMADGVNFFFDPSTGGADQFLRAADVTVGSGEIVYVNSKAAASGSGIVVLRDGNGGLDLSNFSLVNPGRASLSLGGAGGNSDLLYNFQAANLEWRGFTDTFWGTEDGLNNFQNLGTANPDNFYARDNVDFVNTATGTVTLMGNILAGNVSFENTAGNDVTILPFTTETLDAISIAKTSTGNVTIGAAITGSSPMTLDGGTTVLTGANNSTGVVTLNSGTLQIGEGGATGGLTAPVVNNGSIVTNRTGSVILSGIISGSGTITSSGPGFTILTAENTYTGLSTANAGVLQIGNGPTGWVSGDLVTNATIDFNLTPNREYGGTISGTGVFGKRGTSVLTLSGTNTHAGGTNIFNGTLIAGDANIGTGAFYMGPTGTATVTWSIPGGTIDNDIYFPNGGTGLKIINLAAGALDATLSGTIHLDADTATGSGVSRISPATGTLVISGKMTGAGLAGYSKRNIGTVVISNPTNDYSGPTSIVDSGHLIVDGKVPGNVVFGETLGVGGTGLVNGTLGGSGIIGGNVKLELNSSISPGGSSASGVNTDTRATLAVDGGLDATLISGGAGRIRMQLGAPAGPNDRINVGGTLALGTDVIGLNEIVITDAGGLAAGSYTLISAGLISGTLDPANVTGEIVPGLNGMLSISGNNLVLTVTGSGSPYDTWAAGFPGLTDTSFEVDFDNDGIDTGLEWILGGNPTVPDAASIAPVATASAAGGITLSFDREEDSIGVATFSVEYGTTLDTWPGSVLIGAVSSGPDADGVAVTVNDVPDPDGVSVNIPASNADGGKLFARLKATMP